MKGIYKILSVLAAMTLSLVAMAQNLVSGVVKDVENNPLIGAGVVVKGSTNGTVTDFGGNFNIKASKGDVLEISFIGYKNAEVAVTDQATYVITLEDDSNFLNEVVVVGYDTQKKVNLTGAVASLSSDALTNKPITQASTALQGLAAGVTVTTQSGAPGGDGGMIRIRGIGTFGGSDANPLVLIDGVEGDLNSVDASQIDKISVLKDAASSAIYGSRAANGVILVTTKRGVKGEKSITYRGYAGWQEPTRLPSVVGPIDYMILNREQNANDGKSSIYTDDYINNYYANNAVDPDTYPITDWQKAVLLGSGFTHNHDVTLIAGGDRIRTNTSIGYLSQDGVLKNTDFQRINFRSNTDVEISKKLHFKFDINGTYSHRNRIHQQGSIFNYMNTRDPLILSQYSSGYYASLSGSTINARAFLNGEGGNIKNDNYLLNVAGTLTYDPLPWLTIEGKVAPRVNLARTHDFEAPVTTYADAYGTPSSFKNIEEAELTESSNLSYYGNYLATVNVHKTWANAHNFRLLIGAQRETYSLNALSAFRRGFPYTGYEVLDAGSNNEYKSNGGSINEWKLQSYFGRINYNYKERYLIEGNIRFDGSSRFAKGKQWGIFPSGSAAWRITEEPWMQKVKNVLTEAKIRASYGVLGNQNIGNTYYPTVQALNVEGAITMNNNLTPIATLTTLANPDITWEVSSMADAGIDVTLWNKLSATFDWYYKMTDGILMKLAIPQTIGLNAPYQNAGKVRNIGWEFSVGYHDGKGDFTWGVDANLSDVKNTIMDMKGTSSTNAYDTAIMNQEGSPINSIYGYQCLGIVRSQEEADQINAQTPHAFGTVHPGDLHYADIAGAYDEDGNPCPDGKINDQDRTIIGSTIPRYTYGITLNFGWKGINLSAFFQGVGKADGLLSSYYIFPCYSGGTYRTEALGRFQPDDQSTWATATYPRLTAAEVSWKESSYWVADASYCRLKNLQLSYTFPKKLLAKSAVKNLTVFANAQNLFTWTNYYQGYDPELAYSGSNDGVTLKTASNYPQVRTFTFGLDIKF